jgi:hypothetical protein
MISLVPISAQSAFSLNGLIGISNESFTSLNSFEYNPANYNVIKDWGFSFTYGGELEPSFTSNLYQVSAAKTFGNHFVSLRYSPGYQKEFIFKSGSTAIDTTTEPINLENKYSYKELFGFGYSYKFTQYFTAGFNVRYFDQSITKENITIIYGTSQPYFDKSSEVDNSYLWKSDFGLVWKPNNLVTLSLATSNLLLLKSDYIDDDNKEFEMSTNKSVITGLNLCPVKDFNLNLIYETNNSLTTGISKLFPISNNKLGFSFIAFHDKEQNPFFAGIIPSAIFISKYFDISVSWINYLSDRKSTGNFQDFKQNGISNIINNKYSFDKLLLTTNFKLSTLVEQRVKFLDVTISQNIYPALSDRYIDSPIATAKVVNLTNEIIEVKPLIFINGINADKIQSPVTSIAAFDTSEIDFYTSISEKYAGLNPELTYADFYLMTVNDDFDDQYQKAVLINGINAWDGNVHNLKYFIKRDLDFSAKYSKSILTQHKTEIDTLKNATTDFYKSKIIFNAIVKNLTYISDPRASAEFVQYPKQTLELKGGDCDDLSVCYSSLLESVGIETALVDYNTDKNLKHVNIMLNTKLTPDQASLITANDTKYFVRKNENGNGEIWIPVEITSLTDFDTAWSIASDKFQNEALNNFGLIKGQVEIIDIY